jgi:hypothetical protein
LEGLGILPLNMGKHASKNTYVYACLFIFELTFTIIIGATENQE